MMTVSRRRVALTLVVTFAGLAACQAKVETPSQGIAAVDTVAIRASLDSLAAAVGQAYSTGNAEAFGATWDADGIKSAPGNSLVRGVAATR